MANLERVKELLALLKTQQNNPMPLMEELVRVWDRNNKHTMINLLEGHNLIALLAKALNENFDSFRKGFPSVATSLITEIYEYRDEESLFPFEQVQLLMNIFSQYVMNGCWAVMHSFFLSAAFPNAREILLADEDLYNTIKNEITRPYVCAFLEQCAARGFNPWKQKLIKDKELLLSMLSHADEKPDYWSLFLSLALHPDAKSLMPSEVVAKVSNSTNVTCINIYALLCSDNDLANFKLDASYVDAQLGTLEKLLATGYADQEGGVQYFLRSLLPPIVNLSAADAYKESLGKKGVKLLLSIVTDTLPDTPAIRLELSQCRARAAKALWNLAYHKANIIRILDENGIERLEKAKKEASERAFKASIEGILHMCYKETNINSKQTTTPLVASEPSSSGKHIMISYNWNNQPIVKRLAQSLKDHGYNIWLDIEQMGGSTLEAMASAIERSELILMCMSQKYKDSPNCRLEGEYCVNKRIAFVPLMMQKGYTPEGWLGITLGSKLWYDFTDDSEWDSKMAGLTKAIGDHGKSLKSSSNVITSHPVEVKSAGKQVSDWTSQDLLKWMQSEKIEQHFKAFCKHDINGQALLELKHYLNDAHFFSTFQSICKEMGIEKIGSVLQLTAAIRKLK